jgi:hypothetical protein
MQIQKTKTPAPVSQGERAMPCQIACLVIPAFRLPGFVLVL